MLRATRYVGCMNGEVVSSLACFPIDFIIDGRSVAGISIGSVHTPTKHRGHSYASQLIREVEADQIAQGREIGLLYSDIDPGYYERLGYQLCPAWHGTCELDAFETQSLQEPQADPAQRTEPLAVRKLQVVVVLDPCHGAYRGWFLPCEGACSVREANNNPCVERKRRGHLHKHPRLRDVAGHVPLLSQLLGGDEDTKHLVDPGRSPAFGSRRHMRSVV